MTAAQAAATEHSPSAYCCCSVERTDANRRDLPPDSQSIDSPRSAPHRNSFPFQSSAIQCSAIQHSAHQHSAHQHSASLNQQSACFGIPSRLRRSTVRLPPPARSDSAAWTAVGAPSAARTIAGVPYSVCRRNAAMQYCESSKEAPPFRWPTSWPAWARPADCRSSCVRPSTEPV